LPLGRAPIKEEELPEANEATDAPELIEDAEAPESTDAPEPTEPTEASKSLFLAAARAMDDFPIKQRIRAAVAFHAKSLLAAEDGAAKNYAISALLNPQNLDETMMALVLVDQEIAAAIDVSEDGETVTTSSVPDALILVRVQAAWPLVAVKYPSNPLGG